MEENFNNSEKSSELLKKIESKLEPMLEVKFFKNKDNSFDIVKGGIKFGAIKDINVYFLNDKHKMVPFNDILTKSDDDIIRAATSSYWRAIGKIS